MAAEVMANPTTEPFRHFDAEVLATRALGRSMVRVTFGGPALRDVRTWGPDQRIKLFFPRSGQAGLTVPTGADWYTRFRELPDRERPAMRTYTLRAVRHGQIDIDFVRHGDTGPASTWAGRAAVGDRTVILAPNAHHVPENPARMGADYAPPADTAWQLIAGDETALPAIGGIVESLPRGVRARVVLEVPSASDRQDWRTEGEVDTTWLVRGVDTPLLEAIRAEGVPDGPGYAWLAGESSLVRGLRRHLVKDLGVDRKRVYFCGYWREGRPEETAHEPVEED
ncbi:MULTISPECIES: siderophore-interacting protein [Actinosynnema]|nr:siderophore-interacting protein [Actinosynnema pretiosum]